MENFDCLLSAYFLLATCHTQVACSLRPGAFTKDVSPTNSLGTRLGWVGIVLNISKLYFSVQHIIITKLNIQWTKFSVMMPHNHHNHAHKLLLYLNIQTIKYVMHKLAQRLNHNQELLNNDLDRFY